MKVVAMKLMNYEDIELNKGMSEETTSFSDRKGKSRIVRREAGGRKKDGTNPENYETSSSESTSSEFDGDSSKSEQSEESGVEVIPRKGKGKVNSKVRDIIVS